VSAFPPGITTAIGLVLLVAACGSNVSPSPPPSLSPAALATASPTPGVSASSSGPAAESPTSSTLASPIPTDAALLDLLPATLDGLDRQTDPSVDAGIAADPDLARLATSFATALYIDPTTGEFAYVSVVRLQEPLSQRASISYRTSFDDAACAQAGGLQRTAEATIGAHRTWIGSCAGGVRTYHLDLSGGGLVLSVSEAGERRLGEQLIGGLD
jgi:hypothetical protein